MNRLVLWSVCGLVGSVAVLALNGCSTDKPRTTGPNGTAVTGSLPKRVGAPLWNIESVGPVNNAWEKKSFDLPAHGKIEIVGWAVDQEAKAAAGGVEISLDGTPFAAQYGKPRPDVASTYGVPSYSDVGYSLVLTADEFTPGSHTGFVRVLSNDRKGFWEVGPYTFNFK